MKSFTASLRSDLWRVIVFLAEPFYVVYKRGTRHGSGDSSRYGYVCDTSYTVCLCARCLSLYLTSRQCVWSMTDNETFDLADAVPSTIETTVRDAFSEPFTLTEMIRLTFVTGAGKLGRARYDENAARVLTSTLRELGYEEDRGASAILACAGTFKLQHDTGKNLKTVVVFPKVAADSTAADDVGTNGMARLGLGGSALIQEDSIEHKLAHTTMNVFPRMIESKCESWSQKKGCVAALTELKELAESLDGKLMQGQPLTDSEQDFYNTVSLTSLEEKLHCVRDLMAKQVDGGSVTTNEKQQLMEQVKERIQTLEEDIREAKIQNKAKRVENLATQLTKAMSRKEKLLAISTKPPHPLKNEDAIAKLRKELIPILEVEESAKGRLLTLKESQVVGKKDDLLTEISDLEQASRGWFESDAAFCERIQASQTAWQLAQRKLAAAKKKATKTTSSAVPAATKWVVPGAKKTGAWAKPVAKSKPTGGGLFAAMMNDSDSD
jgi:hypothetical protein